MYSSMSIATVETTGYNRPPYDNCRRIRAASVVPVVATLPLEALNKLGVVPSDIFSSNS